MKEISKAKVSGDKCGNTTLSYQPFGLYSGKYIGNCFGAASITLMMQSLVPILAFGKEPSKLLLSVKNSKFSFEMIFFQGGTNVNKSPPFQAVSLVLKELLQKMGVQFDLTEKRPGYYPKGRGEVELIIHPVKVMKNAKESSQDKR